MSSQPEAQIPLEVESGPPLSPATHALLAQDEDLEPKDTYAKKLSERVHKLEHEIRLMKKRQNEVAYPNRMPAELLSDIFLKYSAETIEGTPWRKKTDLSWIWFTHVCQHWRRIALDCTPIWAHLIFDAKPEFTEMMLERSKNSLLHVEFEKQDALSNSVLLQALSFASRLRKVHIECNAKNKLDLTSALAQMVKHSRSLESLSLYAVQNTVNIRLPTEFALLSSSALTELNLDGVDFRWDQLPLNQALLHLGLTPRRRHAGVRQPTWDKIRCALAQTPSLQYLKINSLLPEEALPQALAFTPSVLPKLETIRLTDSTTSVSQLFRLIKIPATALVFIYTTDTLTDTSIDRCIENLRSSWIDDARCKLITGIRELRTDSEIWGDHGPTFDIEYLRTDYTPDDWGWANLRFSLFSASETLVEALMSSLKRHLNLSSLSRLELIGSYQIPASCLANAFSDLPNLEEVQAFSEHSDHVIGMLAHDPAAGQDPSDDIDSSNTPAFFPALKRLHFYEPNFEDLQCKDVDWVINCLKKRSPSRAIELDFEQCDEDMVDYPRAIANAIPRATVIWDGEAFEGAEVSDEEPSESDGEESETPGDDEVDKDEEGDGQVSPNI